MRRQVKHELSDTINLVIADLEKSSDPTSAEVASYILNNYADLVSQHGNELAEYALRRMVQDRLKRSTESRTEQMSLLGVEGLPVSLNYEEGRDIRYVALKKATLAKLISHEGLLARQIGVHTLQYDAILALRAKLEPIFNRYAGITVGEACKFFAVDEPVIVRHRFGNRTKASGE